MNVQTITTTFLEEPTGEHEKESDTECFPLGFDRQQRRVPVSSFSRDILLSMFTNLVNRCRRHEDLRKNISICAKIKLWMYLLAAIHRCWTLSYLHPKAQRTGCMSIRQQALDSHRTLREHSMMLCPIAQRWLTVPVEEAWIWQSPGCFLEE